MQSKIPIQYFTLSVCLLFQILTPGFTQDSQTCPEHFRKILLRFGGSCDAIPCDTSLSQQNCPTGSVYEEGVTMCGCCPGCVRYEKGYLDECIKEIQELPPVYDPDCNDVICPVVKHCKLGLDCLESEPDENQITKFTCSPKQNSDPLDCTNLCFIRRAIIEKENDLYQPRPKRHLPDCTKDGKFGPKQCKGTKNQGDCYCVDECGKRIFGREIYGKADNQTCACSRMVNELRTKKNRIATYHCTQNGDFESLQCDTDSSLCFCVEPTTGKTTGEVLPQHQWKSLPCFDSKDPNWSDDNSYLRVCEGEWAAGQKISREAKLHGLEYSARPLLCDYDGGFSPILHDIMLGQERCVHKGGEQIGGYFRAYAATPIIDCKCARDSVYYPVNGIGFSIECDKGSDDIAIGSYKIYYTAGVNAYCVDSDGYQFGPTIPSELGCCLDNTCNTELKERCLKGNCQNIGDPGCYPYKPCAEYFMGRD